MERGLKYINCVEEPRFISMFGNVVENNPRVALLLFKLRPFLNAESFFCSLEKAIDSLTPPEKVYLKPCSTILISLTSIRSRCWTVSQTSLVAWLRPISSARSPAGSTERPDWTSWLRLRGGDWGVRMRGTGTSSASPSSSAPGETRQQPFWRDWAAGGVLSR